MPDNQPVHSSMLEQWFVSASRPEGTGRRPVFVIGEVGQAHDGSLGTAHSYIDGIAEAGADAVKFQTHIADAESTPEEPWRVRFSQQDERRIDYWRRMEFSTEQWAGLKRHAEDLGLVFLSSPFSIEAVELLEGLGIAGWKVASGELANTPMLDAIADTDRPILLSTGMSGWAEIDAAVERLGRGDDRKHLAIFQCTSAYPCPPESVGLNLLDEIAQRYGCPVGLSDHSGTIFPVLAGVARGMQLAEVHVTLSRRAFGPDVPASLTVEELSELVRGVRATEAMLAHPVDKEEQANRMAPMRKLFQRSLVTARALDAGEVLLASDLCAKKPANGLPPERLDELVGRRLLRPLVYNEVVSLEDLAPELAPEKTELRDNPQEGK